MLQIIIKYLVFETILINTLNCLCSFNEDQQIKLLELTPKQKLDIDILLNELESFFILTTYLIDPIDNNACYLFIENTETKEINYYTIKLNEENSFTKLKNEILQTNLSLDDLFYSHFENISNIHYEIKIFKNLSVTYNLIRYNNFIKRIMNNFFTMMLKFDSNKIIKKKFNRHCYMDLNKTITYICQNLLNFIKLSNPINILNLFTRKYMLNKTLNLNILEYYIFNKLSKTSNFISFTLDEKFKYITKISKNTYIFCIRHKISMDHIIIYMLGNINSIKNKLDKFTLVMCFLKIYTNENNYHCRPRLLKLSIFTLIYLKNSSFEINNTETLLLLQNIVKKRLLEKQTNAIKFQICVLDKLDNDTLKNIIIRRYTYIVVFYRDDYLISLKNLNALPKYFSLIWLIVKCFTVTIYNIFKIDLH